MTWRRWFNKYIPESHSWENGYLYSDLSLAIDAALDGEGLFLADNLLCLQEIRSGALVPALDAVMRSTFYCVALPEPDIASRNKQLFTHWLSKSLDSGTASTTT